MGRNLEFKKILTMSSLIRKYDVIVILMFRQLKLKVFIVSSFFGCIKLKFGVLGNFRLLISNINSKTVRNLKKMPLFFEIMIFSPALPYELVTMQGNNEWPAFNLCVDDCLKWHKLKISWTVWDIQRESWKTFYFLAVAIWRRYKIYMMMTLKILVNW